MSGPPREIVAEIVAPDDAAELFGAWQDLAIRALEPNAFYNPEVVAAALAFLPERRGARLLLAWRQEVAPRRLVGLLPLVRSRGRFLNPAPIRRAAACYGTLSTPLLDPEDAPAILRAMLGALADAGIGALALPYLHEDGPVAAALAAAVTELRLPVIQLASHRRAMLRTPLAFPDYLRTILDGRRRKEIDRKRRRLGEHGALAFRVLQSADEVSAAIERFLYLEASGWKGRGGTALDLAPGGGAFARALGRAGGLAGRVRVAELTIDGRTVASGVVLTAGRRAFYFKTSFDETLARFSPGFILTLDLTAHLVADPDLDEADSIAVADHPMIDRLWTERFPVASVVVATRPGGGATFRAAVAIERGREATWAALKERWVKWRAA